MFPSGLLCNTTLSCLFVFVVFFGRREELAMASFPATCNPHLHNSPLTHNEISKAHKPDSEITVFISADAISHKGYFARDSRNS